MKPNLLIGLVIGLIGHAVLFLSLRVNLVDPGPGPSADAQFILIAATPESARTDEALLRDPSIFYLPSRVSLRPTLGRYSELIEPSVFFDPFQPDTASGLETVVAMGLNYPPAPAIMDLAQRGPVFDFALQRRPLDPVPTARDTPAVTGWLRDLTRPGSAAMPLTDTDLPGTGTLFFQITDPRIPQLPALLPTLDGTTVSPLPIPALIGTSGYFSLSTMPPAPETEPTQ